MKQHWSLQLYPMDLSRISYLTVVFERRTYIIMYAFLTNDIFLCSTKKNRATKLWYFEERLIERWVCRPIYVAMVTSDGLAAVAAPMHMFTHVCILHEVRVRIPEADMLARLWLLTLRGRWNEEQLVHVQWLVDDSLLRNTLSAWSGVRSALLNRCATESRVIDDQYVPRYVVLTSTNNVVLNKHIN